MKVRLRVRYVRQSTSHRLSQSVGRAAGHGRPLEVKFCLSLGFRVWGLGFRVSVWGAEDWFLWLSAVSFVLNPSPYAQAADLPAAKHRAGSQAPPAGPKL